ncbi:MAG: DUF1697 domain-containing protein [Actinomycetota bacterium]
MNQYVAFLRGIAPSNPAMKNDNLRAVSESLGLRDVSTVISSGNIVFQSDVDDIGALEAMMEEAWPARLGFDSTTIIRRRRDLEELVERRPFGDREHGRETYLLVTFSRGPLAVDFEVPHFPPDGGFAVVAATDRELFTVSDTNARKTPDVMSWLESRFGKQISSRTWLTVQRILKRMG